MRLGVEAALVEGRLVPGDVAVDGGRVTAVGVEGIGGMLPSVIVPEQPDSGNGAAVCGRGAAAHVGLACQNGDRCTDGRRRNMLSA